MSERRWGTEGQPIGVLLRNSEHFTWASMGGILMLDYDPPKDGFALSRESLLQGLYESVPALSKAAHFWWPSAGSCIWDEELETELVGIRGQRLYVWVSNAADIPRIGELLEARLWLAGHGRFDISKAGSLLPRTLVDTAVWQPERLDFAAGTLCKAPLVQRRPSPARLGGDDPLDTRALPCLTDVELEAMEKIKTRAQAAVKADSEKVKVAWIAARGAEIQSARDLGEEDARNVALQAVEHDRLMGDFVLISHDGKPVTVGEILDNRPVWQGERFHDPLEPEDPDERIAMVNLYSGGRPYLWSHAHGGRRYELSRTVATISVQAGGTAAATEETLRYMLEDGSFFERGSSVVTVTENGDVKPLGPYALKQKIERGICFQKWDERKKDFKRADCPDEIARRVLDMRGASGLDPLGGIVLYPTMTPAGRMLDKPGYDNDTKLLLLNPSGKAWPKIPDRPTDAQVLAALQFLWTPVAKFPYVDDTSRAVCLAAMLTAVTRRCLATAPAVMFAAPSAGSGKTLLGSCVVELAGGGPAMPLPDSDAEIAKTLISLLRRGAGALFFDNVVGTVDSKSLNAMLTSSEFDGRILGLSEMAGALPTNTMVVLTGNNARPGGDTCRRMLVCNIDPRMEAPYLREFSFDPLQQIRASKMGFVAAALTVLRGWCASGMARVAPGSLASFDEWDRLVRQAVVWVGQLERDALGASAVGYGDPIAGIDGQYASDEETETLGTVLEAWSAIGPRASFKAAELYRAVDMVRRGELRGSQDLAALGAALLEAMPKVQTPKGVGKG